MVGTADGLADNQVSKPIEGQKGVYAVQKLGAKQNEMPEDLSQNQTRLAQQMKGRFGQFVILNALKSSIEIVDNGVFGNL